MRFDVIATSGNEADLEWMLARGEPATPCPGLSPPAKAGLACVGLTCGGISEAELREAGVSGAS